MANLASELTSLLSNLRTGAIDKALGSDIPLVGTALDTASAAFFTGLQGQITSALAGKTTAAEIATALNGITGSPAVATDNGDGTVSIEIKANDTQHVALANTGLNIGDDNIGLELKTDLSTDIKASADLKLKFDTAGTGTLTLDPANTRETPVTQHETFCLRIVSLAQDSLGPTPALNRTISARQPHLYIPRQHLQAAINSEWKFRFQAHD